MKHLISLLLVVGLVGSMEAQVSFERNGTRYNEASMIYYKSGFLAGTASDTISFLSIPLALDLTLWGTANDSTTVLPYYQLRNSTTGAVSAWTAMDTIGTDGSGNTPTATGPATDEMSGGSIALATLNGFDEVRFYFDYLTGSPANADGTDNILKVYLYVRALFKP